MIGLSGLITPSLDEMVHVAARDGAARDVTMPLLIGGATTSRAAHRGEDRAGVLTSRSCTCWTPRGRSAWCRGLLDPRQRPAFDAAEPRGAGAPARAPRDAPRAPDPTRTRPAVRAPAGIDWRAEDVAARRSSSGRRVLVDVPLAEHRPVHRLDVLLPRLGAEGEVPADPGAPAPRRGRPRAVRQRAPRCSTAIVEEKLLRARGVYGFWPANSRRRRHRALDGRDRSAELLRFPMLRQQRVKADDKPHTSPRRLRRPASTAACATTWAGSRSPPASAPTTSRAAFEAEHDDYTAIMVKALADRLAEAFAEMLHAARPPGVGLRRGRGAHQRAAHRGEVPRHPPRLRLPGLPRSHREEPALRPAERRGDRHDPVREPARCCRPRR